jgi:hypothetical protein
MLQQDELALDAQQFRDAPALFVALRACQRFFDCAQAVGDFAVAYRGFGELAEQPAGSVIPSAVATVIGTSPASHQGPSSATHTPPENLGSNWRPSSTSRPMSSQTGVVKLAGGDEAPADPAATLRISPANWNRARRRFEPDRDRRQA